MPNYNNYSISNGKGKLYLKSSEPKEGYEKGLREELPKFLNLHNMKAGKDKTHLSDIIENMITAELNHSVKIGRNPLTPLDLPEHRYSKDSAAYIDAINTIVRPEYIVAQKDNDKLYKKEEWL